MTGLSYGLTSRFVDGVSRPQRAGTSNSERGVYGTSESEVRSECGWFVEIVKGTDDLKGFKLLPAAGSSNLYQAATISPNEQGLRIPSRDG